MKDTHLRRCDYYDCYLNDAGECHSAYIIINELGECDEVD